MKTDRSRRARAAVRRIEEQLKASTDPKWLCKQLAPDVVPPAQSNIPDKLDEIAFLLERIAEHLGAI